jgi:hypothetical protein
MKKHLPRRCCFYRSSRRGEVGPVHEFHGATEEGFLVSHDKRVYWLVGTDGKTKAQRR